MTRCSRSPTEGLFGLLVLDQLDGTHQPEAAHIAHCWVGPQLFEQAQKVFALLGAALRQFLTLQNLDVLQCRGARHCLAAKGQQVGERHVLLLELVKQLCADRDRGDWRVSRRQPFGHCH